VACNDYLNIYYAYSCVHVHSILFMLKYVFVKCLKCVMYVFLVNILCLEKPDGLVFQARCSGLPNQIVRFWQTEYMFLLV
jgi:hypothetical protein